MYRFEDLKKGSLIRIREADLPGSDNDYVNRYKNILIPNHVYFVLGLPDDFDLTRHIIVLARSSIMGLSFRIHDGYFNYAVEVISL